MHGLAGCTVTLRPFLVGAAAALRQVRYCILTSNINNNNLHGKMDPNEAEIRKFISSSQSDDEEERKRVISKIPVLILQFLKTEDKILNQLLLVIYNLNTSHDPYEYLTASNRIPIFRHLLRLYTDTVKDHEQTQIDALSEIIDLVYSSEILVELAYALKQCKIDLGDKGTAKIEEAFENIREKSSVNLYSEALLVIYDIRTS